MTDTAGFVIHGTEDADHLSVKVKVLENGDKSISNILDGGGGDDWLSGNTDAFFEFAPKYGATFYGRAGNDYIKGSVGPDKIYGGSGDDYIVETTDSGDIINGGSGWDTIDVQWPTFLTNASITSVEQLDIHSLLLVKSLDINQFKVINSVVHNTAAQISFSHRTEMTNVKFTGERWSISGSSGSDVFDVSKSVSQIQVLGYGGDDLIIGGAGRNSLDGAGGNDTLFGGDGADWLLGGAGHNTIHGGSGNDAVFDDEGSNVVFGDSGTDTITENFSTATVHGGADDDKLELYHGRGFAFGDDGNDTITVTNGRYSVHGGAGDDRLMQWAYTKNDISTLSGGSGNDLFFSLGEYGYQSSVLHGGSGEDTLYLSRPQVGELQADGIEIINLSALAGDEINLSAGLLGKFKFIDTGFSDDIKINLTSGGSLSWRTKGHVAASVELNGSNQDDQIDLQNSQSVWTVYGKSGDDRIIGGADRNGLFGGAGDDTLISHGIGDGLFGNQGNDTLIGRGQTVVLNGGVGDDRLTGDGTEVYMIAGAGDDTLIASSGYAEMHGNQGHDRFIFSNTTHQAVVYDFTRQGPDRDIIDVSAVSQIKDFDDLTEHHVKTAAHNAGLLIHYGDTEILLMGIKAGDLSASSFVF